MAYEAKILADSITKEGHRLTTLEVVFPRFILPEFNTHRMLSRNTASSRAIPVKKMIAAALNNPYVPEYWGINQPGMQAETVLDEDETEYAKHLWLSLRNQMVLGAVALIGGADKLEDDILEDQVKVLNDEYGDGAIPLPHGLHKQIPNRLLEPFLWHRAIVSGTEWENFYALRNHPNAQPEIHKTAATMYQVHRNSKPQPTDLREWHLPLIFEEDRQLDLAPETLAKVAVGRCARISYLTHDGRRDIEKDIALHDDLLRDGHMSPFEHVATPRYRDKERLHRIEGHPGNFVGWEQYRHRLPSQHNFGLIRRQQEPGYQYDLDDYFVPIEDYQ